jgi:energy-converting hydrogenase Eha subunit C
VLAVGAALSLAGRSLAPRLGWRPVPTALAVASLALAVGVTLARRPLPSYMVDRSGGLCLMNGFVPAGIDVRYGTIDPLVVLNFLMLMPFGFFAVLATRRIIPIAAASVLFVVAVETIQTVTRSGSCESQDVFNNISGALLAMNRPGMFADFIS